MSGNNAGPSLGAMNVLANGVLIGAVILVGVAGIALIALTMANQFDESAGMKRLRCLAVPTSSDCPARKNEVRDLQEELAALQAKSAATNKERLKAEAQLAGLKAIEDAVDEVTLFKTHSSLFGPDVVVGTVYRQFVEANPSPDHHFCYISLSHGEAGESRNLYFHGRSGPFDISAEKLEGAGLSEKTLIAARKLCKPFLIGEAS